MNVMERDPRTPGEPAAPPEYGTPDEDTPELTEEMMKRARPLRDILAERGLPIPAALGRPKSADKKLAISVRLDPEIVAYFKGTGPGWQTRLNDMLGAAVKNIKASNGQ